MLLQLYFVYVNGSLVLKMYYTRDSYNVAVSTNNTLAGTIVNVSGTYRYGTELTLSATTNAGYTFDGWYSGSTLVSANLSHTFTLSENVNYVATWHANTNTPYKIEYYLQNLNNDDYSVIKGVKI